jgi:WD40 repeat protein
LSCLLKGTQSNIRSVAFTPDGSYLVTGNDEGRLNVYDSTSGSCVATLTGHSSWILSIDTHLDGNHFVSRLVFGSLLILFKFER